MATHAAFLRQEGIDWTLSKGTDKRIGVDPAQFNPNAAFGKVYWVDENTGSDLSTGLTPATAFATIGQAITISNAEVGNYNMNTIYVNAQTYTESLTTAPKNVNIIAIGGKVRLQGVQSFTASQNWHFYNFQFRYSTGTMITIASTSYSCGFHGCRFDSTGNSIAISAGGAQDFVIEDCTFHSNPLHTTAIQITGNSIRFLIRNNYIAATTNGILIDNVTGIYGAIIADNYIGRVWADANSSTQMAYGIRMAKTTGTAKIFVVNNRIEALDAISSATADNAAQFQMVGNRTGQGTTAAWEDA